MPRSEDITYQIGANTTRFQKGMADVNKISKSAISHLKGLGGALGIGLGAVSIGGVVAAVRSASAAVVDLASEARTAGLSFETFQELKYAADQNNVSIEALTDGIKELQLRADEFVVSGTGSAVEAFERIGFSAETLEEALKKPEQLFEDVIDRISELDTAAQIRVADELFGGTGGEQFVRLLDQGAGSIARMRQEARDMGLVMSEELVKKAEEIDRKFKLIEERVGVGIKTAIIEAAGALSDFLNYFRQIEQLSQDALVDRLVALTTEDQRVRSELNRLLADREGMSARSLALNAGVIDGQIQNLENRLQSISSEMGRIADIQHERVGDVSLGDGSPTIPPRTPTKTDELTRLIAMIRQKTAVTLAETAAQAELNPLIEDYGFAVEKARVTQELLNAAQKAGKEITPELAATIDELASTFAAASAESKILAESQDELRQSAQEFSDIAQGVLKGFISDLKEGKSAADILTSSMSRLGDKLIDIGLNALFDGGTSGGIGGLLAGLITNAKGNVFNQSGLVPFAKGGIVDRPTVFPFAKGIGLMGEAGPEAILPLSRGPNGDLGVRMNGGGAQSVVRVELAAGLRAEILSEAAANSVEIVENFDEQELATRVHEISADRYGR